MTAYLSSLRIKRNAISTVIQVLISGLVFFVLYRYLYEVLGVEQIGVWSLVLATTAVSRIGDLGLSAGVVRFVAQALGRNDTRRAADVVQTVALTLGFLMGVFLVVGYPLFVLALGYFIPAHSETIALGILPYALMSLWSMVIVTVFSGGLDGCLRMDLRSLFMGLSHLAYLGLTLILVPVYGLEGVAIAQLIQSVGLMIVLWWVLRLQIKSLPIMPLHWNFSVLKEMIGYGVNFQIITVMNMLFDPMVKALMSKFGGLEALGYYEMANKLILQGRALIVEASRVMVPAIASLQELDETTATKLFHTSYRLTFFVSILFYGLLGVFLTTICQLWLGDYQSQFIQFALLLNLGWFANTLIGPAYFSNLGSGKLGVNMVSHVILSLCTLFIGVVLGLQYGGVGVVSGVTAGLFAGSVFVLVVHFKQRNLSLLNFGLTRDMALLLLSSLMMVFFSNYEGSFQESISSIAFIALSSSVFVLLVGWFSPTRKMLIQRIQK